MRIESANRSEPGRKENRSRGNLGGKKEQMRKITTISVISLLFTAATVLGLTLLFGCTSSKKAAVTPLPSTSYYGGGAYHEYAGNAKLAASPSPLALPSTGDEVWIIAR